MRNEYDANEALQRAAQRTQHRKHYEHHKENRQCLSFLVVFVLACALGAAIACNM